jgi:hypothetical protein
MQKRATGRNVKLVLAAMILIILVLSSGFVFYYAQTVSTIEDLRNQIDVEQQQLSDLQAQLINASITLKFPSGLPLFLASNGNLPGEALVLLMQTNSVAFITLNYTSWLGGYQDNGTLTPSVGVGVNQTTGGATSNTVVQTPNVVASATPERVPVNESTPTTVVLTLSSNGASKGFYLLGIPWLCPYTLLAVGFPLNQVNYTAFDAPVINCPAFGYDISIVGLSGLAYTYVRIAV